MAITSYADWIKGIKDTKTAAYAAAQPYESALQARLAQLKANRDIGINEQQALIDTSGQSYNPLRNEAFTQDQIAQKNLRERLANMGMGATGGTSQTLDLQRSMGLRGQLGQIGLQQQNYIDTARRKMAELGIQYGADETSAIKEIEAQKAQALQEQYWKQVALEQQQEEARFSRAWALYQKKKITAKQFATMTGISVKAYAVKKKSKQPKSDGLSLY